MTPAATLKNSVSDDAKKTNETKSPLNDVAEQICRTRYYRKDANGNVIEDWKGLVTRVINTVCGNDTKEFQEVMFDIIYNTKFLPNSPCLVNAGTGSIKGLLACQPGWAKINTDKGLVKIEDIVNSNDSFKVDTAWGVSTITNRISNGKKPVLRIETEKGYFVDVTPDHKIFVIKNYRDRKWVHSQDFWGKGQWTEASEINNGDALFIDFNEKSFSSTYIKRDVEIGGEKTTVTVDEDLATLLAYTKCDGNLSYQFHDKRHLSTYLHFEIIVDSKEALDLLSNNKYLIKYNEIDIENTKNNRNLKRLRTYGKKQYSWLFNFGEFNSANCNVPYEIFLSPKTVVRDFIRATFECEGTVVVGMSQKSKPSATVSVGMISESYIRDIQSLLNMFGIQSSVYGPIKDKRTDCNRRDMWCVTLTNVSNISKFYEKIGFISKTKSDLLFNYLQSVDISRNYNKTLFEVKKIKHLGEFDVYDISTSNETYLSQGIVVHNCHTSAPPGDSWKEIARNIECFGSIARKGGGNGTCFSFIRPSGDPVFGSTHAKACGPVEVMRMTSEAMHSITQSGFRAMACTPGDTYVATEKGYIQIRDIVNEKMDNIKIHTQFGTARILESWYNGQKEVFEIISERGYKVQLTGDHLIYVIDKYNGTNHGKLSKKINTVGKWKRVDQLDLKKDCLVINLDEKPFGTEYQYINDIKIDEKMASLIAYLKCDGLVASYSKGHRAQLFLDSEQSYDYFVNSNFNGLDFGSGCIEKKYTKSGKEFYAVQKNGKQTEFLDNFGEYHSNECDIPKEIFMSPKSVISSFLRASFDAEDTVSVRNNRCVITTGMISLKYIEGLQVLLSMFGIQSSIRRNVKHIKNDGCTRQDMHYLSINNKWHIKKFMDEIAHFSDNKNKKVISKLKTMNFSGKGRGTVPSYKRIHRIKSIKSIGLQDVYDITSSDETFLANSIVVHNCMGTLHIWHPDIEDFIKCKQRERALKTLLREDIFGHFEQLNGKTHEHLNIVLDKFISNFNISVMVSDKFMNAVEQDGDWSLEFNGKIYKTVKARYLFNLIAENAWKNGDPGLLFEDAINDSPYKYSNQVIDATNPCVIEGSKVPTEFGWKKVEDIKVGDKVFTRGQLHPVTTIEKNLNCEVYKVGFTDGDHVTVTENHQFKTIVGKKYRYERMKELSTGAKIRVETFDWKLCQQYDVKLKNNSIKYLQDHGVNTSFSQYDLGQLLGIVVGDGCYTESSQGSAKVSAGKHEVEWISYLKSLLNRLNIRFSEQNSGSAFLLQSRQLGEIVAGLGLIPAKATKKMLPSCVYEANIEFYKGLIDGLFSTDGNMYLKKDNPMLRYSSSNHDLCRQIKEILLGFDIHARIYTSIRKKNIYNDPRYGPREISSKNPKHDIVIMNDGIVSFNKNIKLHNIYKQNKITQCVNEYHIIGGSRTASIKKIEKLTETYTTYDLYVESTDEWNVHGYVNRGCGEQPLPAISPIEVRNGTKSEVLPSKNTGGSCNLGSIDISKFYCSKTNDIDWKDFELTIKNCVRFLDNVIDANSFPTPDFAEWAYENRPVGLGIMGLADLFLKMNISYGSQESIDLSEKIAKFMHDTSHALSVHLAQKRGTPSACNYKELDFRRNVTLLSIAPTGTISLLAGCSSSIEPIFSPVIYRYDNTGNYCMPHPDSDKKHFRCVVDKDNPDREVKYQEHVDIQAAWQKWVDSGVSKTINMSNSATIDDVKECYMRAWENKCKGITIYRDGCKTTQVLNTSKKKAISFNDASKRPQVVDADIYKTTANGIEWHIMIGKVDGYPYELFAVNGKQELPKSGKIVKKSKQHYCLTDNNDNILIDNIVKEEELLDSKISLETRRFSLELRHGIPPKYIVEQIDKSNDLVTSFSKAVGRIFKTHYLTHDELKSISKNAECPECAKRGECGNIVFESGCCKCLNCSYSKCG